MAETRKLAAILAADVAGYSRLAGADEERTLARLRALRSDLLDPTIALHHGRVVKRTGDGILIEFRSVVDAVRCAIEVQNGMVERNAGLPPERRIEFRVGIHLGDVVEESDGDLMGDGVNIAARLEGIAKPGGICLSEDAYRQVKARLDLAVNDLGATNLKNIVEPIRVYSLQIGAPGPNMGCWARSRDLLSFYHIRRYFTCGFTTPGIPTSLFGSWPASAKWRIGNAELRRSALRVDFTCTPPIDCHRHPCRPDWCRHRCN
jgi:class 3 adenylate cyclase